MAMFYWWELLTLYVLFVELCAFRTDDSGPKYSHTMIQSQCSAVRGQLLLAVAMTRRLPWACLHRSLSYFRRNKID